MVVYEFTSLPGALRPVRDDNYILALKGLCHAICYIFKKLNGLFASIESQK